MKKFILANCVACVCVFAGACDESNQAGPEQDGSHPGLDGGKSDAFCEEAETPDERCGYRVSEEECEGSLACDGTACGWNGDSCEAVEGAGEGDIDEDLAGLGTEFDLVQLDCSDPAVTVALGDLNYLCDDGDVYLRLEPGETAAESVVASAIPLPPELGGRVPPAGRNFSVVVTAASNQGAEATFGFYQTRSGHVIHWGSANGWACTGYEPTLYGPAIDPFQGWLVWKYTGQVWCQWVGR